MKAIIFEQHGPIENLKLADIEAPSPAEGEVLIKVHAVALNGFDPMILAQIPGIKTPLPMIPGGDISGEVVGFGPRTEVPGFTVGSRVMVNPLVPGKGVFGETVRGGACELITVPAENLVAIPDGVSYEDAAALPIAYGTAYRMMMTRAQVKAGDKVLILGATGGVGVCCVQIAKLIGAEVAACTSSTAKAEMLRALGADHVINTSEEDFVEVTKKIWGKPRVFDDGGGADIVINYVGGDDWAKALRCARRNGKILTCGATNGFGPATDIRYIWSFELNIIGSNCWSRSDLVDLLALVAEGKLKPAISSSRPVEELAVSFREMQERKVFGKAVLTVA